jgi:serine/threonine protein kinase
MRECLSCDRCFDDGVERCPDDGAPAPRSLPGPRLFGGKYLLERHIGSGGMGTVYRATHVDLQRSVAIKLLRLARKQDDSAVARFQLEALALGRLEHPAIVRPTDFGIDRRGEGVPFLVMDLLEGRTLFAALQEKPLRLDEAMEVFADLASGIDHAHGRGILHRDIKPGNILLSERGAKPAGRLFDFGLARFAEAGPLSPADRASTAPGLRPSPPPDAIWGPLTNPDFIIGTPGYLAPELLQGSEPSVRSDLYAFGVVFYEALVGRHPDSTVDCSDVGGGPLKLRLGPPEKPSCLRRNLPPEIDAPLLAGLDLDPERRPASARELVESVRDAISRSRREEEKAVERRRLRKWSLLLFVAATLMAALLGSVWPLAGIERRLADRRLTFAPPRLPDPRILLISIDDATLVSDPTALADQADPIGRFLEGALDAGAKGVAVDILAPASWGRSEPFGRALLRFPERIVLAASSTPGDSVLGPEAIGPLVAVALGPTRTSNLFAFANVEADDDGILRAMRPTFVDDQGRPRESLAARAVSISTGGIAPPAPERAPRIDFTVDPEKFERVSWKDALGTLEASPGRFRHRILLIGGEYAASGDALFRIPAPPGFRGESSGLTLQALMANTALRGYPVRTWNGFGFLLLFAALGAALGIGCELGSPSPLRRLVLVGVAALFLVAASFLLSSRTLWLTPLVTPTASLVAAATLAEIVRRLRPRNPENPGEKP